MADSAAQFTRLAETQRASLDFFIDGAPATAALGDTILTALLVNRRDVRLSEFGDGPRGGFCNMAACQDCWVDTEEGTRLRACSTFLERGMRIVTRRSRQR